jgi:chemotaxis protein histidine kinase CheA
MKFGEIAIREKKLEAGKLIKAIRAQKIRNVSGEQYVKIPIRQLDLILDIVKCLESTQKNLHNESMLRLGSDDALAAEIKKAGEMSADIAKIIQELRLVTLQQPFRKITRAVRAMIEESGMHVVFSTIGENTEIMKETAEDIILPLAELIELILSVFRSQQEPDQEKLGNIELAAYRQDNSVIIEVSNNRIAYCESLTGYKKMDDICRKIKKVNGQVEFEDLEDSGCKVKIIIPAD